MKQSMHNIEAILNFQLSHPFYYSMVQFYRLWVFPYPLPQAPPSNLSYVITIVHSFTSNCKSIILLFKCILTLSVHTLAKVFNYRTGIAYISLHCRLIPLFVTENECDKHILFIIFRKVTKLFKVP